MIVLPRIHTPSLPALRLGRLPSAATVTALSLLAIQWLAFAAGMFFAIGSDLGATLALAAIILGQIAGILFQSRDWFVPSHRSFGGRS